MVNGNLLFWVESLQLQYLGSRGLAGEKMLCFLYDPTRLLSQRVMLLHGWLSVTISHLPVKSNGTELIEDEILSFQYDK